jgi:hypothetical protein
MTTLAPAIPVAAVSPWQEISLNRIFWFAVSILVAVVALTAHPQYWESSLGAAMVGLAALVPIWLWMAGKVKGLPLFPVYASTHIATYSLPLLYEHPIVALFPANNQLIGAATVTGFLLLGTAVWYFVGHRSSRPVTRCLLLNPTNADAFFLATLAGATIFNISINGHWVNLDPGIFAIVRAVALALAALGCFALAYRTGAGELSFAKTWLFRLLISVLILSNIPSLLLVNAMSIVVIAALGYTLGARRFPWLTCFVAIIAFVFLHAGKGDMRAIYWGEDEDPTIQPWNYPSFLTQWAGISAGNVTAGKTQTGEESATLLERASLMQLLLFEQIMTPDEVSFMEGETYAVIPILLVPRIFNPNKPASHEGTYLLNIHYGFQTREATATTTIGFGLLNESYANFGYVGVALLATVLGGYYAAVSRWAQRAPVLSFRSLFAIVVASYAFQTEFAAGVYVSALFQSICALLVVAALFMRQASCGQIVPAARA